MRPLLCIDPTPPMSLRCVRYRSRPVGVVVVVVDHVVDDDGEYVDDVVD